ncbi:hypothetical protein [Legionella fallonii]|uniref:Transmembrane protein n=1 Tax=Legionella fallonii LLAP-10 TaxID=1212491 RepID=A0A098G3U5_9GAMM|nr:hypothetical protein [Legionella fallonii]CEG56155.1 conserved membrane protein of unknown function [Legionella fallonii LLAP-10]
MFTKDPKEVFKKIIIIFWMIWWLIALWTDVVGLLAHHGLLIKSWAPNTNLPHLIDSLKMYSLPSWAPHLFFIGILLWSFISTAAFVWTGMSLHREVTIWMRRADIAFVISISFWLAFFLADQLVMKFDLEENHMVQGGFQLLTYLMLYLLPSGKVTDK